MRVGPPVPRSVPSEVIDLTDGAAPPAPTDGGPGAQPLPDGRELRRAALAGIVLLALLNVADVVTTELMLARGGIELNPIADYLIGSNTALVAKLALVVMLAVHVIRRGPRVITLCLLWLVTGMYVMVVIVNGTQLLSVWGE